MKQKINILEDFKVLEITKGDITLSLTFTKDDYVDRDKVEIKAVTNSGKDRGIIIRPCSGNKLELMVDKSYDDYIRAVERITGEEYKF